MTLLEEDKNKRWRASRRRIILWCALIALTFIGLPVIWSPISDSGIHKAHANVAVQNARAISLLCFQYATDHNDRYPDGKSSTEVFQKFLDEKYATDPTIFYLPLAGKIRPTSLTLKPENVGYDLTSGLDANSPDDLPVVFMTGYRIDYRPGGSAKPLSAIRQYFSVPPRTWAQWWNGEPAPSHQPPTLITGIAVAYKNNRATYLKQDDTGTVPNFIPADVDLQGKTYRQLTPTGSLP